MKSCDETKYCDFLKEGKPVSKSYQFNSWVKEYDVICDKSSERVKGQTIYFLINPFVYYLFTAISDSFGRLKMFYLSILLLNLTLVSTVYIQGFIMKTVVLGIAQGLTASIASLAVVLVNEIMPEGPLRSKPSAYLFFGYGLGGLQVTLLTYFIKNSNTLMWTVGI